MKVCLTSGVQGIPDKMLSTLTLKQSADVERQLFMGLAKLDAGVHAAQQRVGSLQFDKG